MYYMYKVVYRLCMNVNTVNRKLALMTVICLHIFRIVKNLILSCQRKALSWLLEMKGVLALNTISYRLSSDASLKEHISAFNLLWIL